MNKKNKNNFTNDQLLKFYEKMFLIRKFEEKAAQLYGAGKIGGFCHLYIGQEAVVIGILSSINSEDTVITAYRDHGHILARGVDPKLVMAELTGRKDGISKGKGGSMHMFSKANRFYGGHGIVGAQVPLGVGIGSAITSTTDGGQGNIASQQQLDMAVPDPEFCRQWGASAFVIDVEMYTTLNPSTSFVTQPALQPGCVIRRENWTVLQKQGAISNEDVRECKQRMNTFAYIGSIRDKPIVKCVYQTDVNENKFIIKGDGQAEDGGVGINKEAIQF